MDVNDAIVDIGMYVDERIMHGDACSDMDMHDELMIDIHMDMHDDLMMH